jgi:hypothetical protein
MMVGKLLESSECILVDIAAILTSAAEQCVSCCTEGSILPTRVLFARIALPALQHPLEGIIDDPPIRVELRYEPI